METCKRHGNRPEAEFAPTGCWECHAESAESARDRDEDIAVAEFKLDRDLWTSGRPGPLLDSDGCDLTEAEIGELLSELILDGAAEIVTADFVSARSFAEAGVMTRNQGLVVTIDGAEFQITIVRSR